MISKANYDYIVKLLGDGLNVKYVSQFTSANVKLVEQIADGSYVRVPVRVGKAKIPAAPSARSRQSLVPVTMPPFPDLTMLNDRQRIIVLIKRGLAAVKIRRHLTQQISVKRISSYANKVLGPAPNGINNSRANQIHPSDMPYVLEAMRRLGKNRLQCEICLDPVPGGCIVHHTKYEGATVYDLMFVCGSCNQARANKGLS